MSLRGMVCVSSSSTTQFMLNLAINLMNDIHHLSNFRDGTIDKIPQAVYHSDRYLVSVNVFTGVTATSHSVRQGGIAI